MAASSSSLIRNSAFLLVLTFLVTVTSTTRYVGARHIDVKLTNYLGAGLNLTVHCKSIEDLGVHVLPYKGFYNFTMDLSFFEVPPHYCEFKWQNVTYPWFLIYEQSRDWNLCRNYCHWSIKQQRLCMRTSKSGAAKELCYTWGS
ncbi:hypothetical protein COP2_037437 [Malus domestica]